MELTIRPATTADAQHLAEMNRQLCDDERSRNPAKNSFTRAEVIARRRRLKKDFDLPMKGEYGDFVRGLVTASAKCE